MGLTGFYYVKSADIVTYKLTGLSYVKKIQVIAPALTGLVYPLDVNVKVNVVSNAGSPLSANIVISKDGTELFNSSAPNGSQVFKLPEAGTYVVSLDISDRTLNIVYDGITPIILDFVVLGITRRFRVRPDIVSPEEIPWSNVLTVRV